MKREEFDKIIEGDSCLGKYKQNNALLGLNIIVKYLPNSGIEGAEHDIIFACDIDDLILAGIIEEDVKELRNLNWGIDHDYSSNCLRCYV